MAYSEWLSEYTQNKFRMGLGLGGSLQMEHVHRMCQIPYGCKGEIPYEREGERMGHSVTVTHSEWAYDLQLQLTPVNHLVEIHELAHAHRFGGAEARKGPSHVQRTLSYIPCAKQLV